MYQAEIQRQGEQLQSDNLRPWDQIKSICEKNLILLVEKMKQSDDNMKNEIMKYLFIMEINK